MQVKKAKLNEDGLTVILIERPQGRKERKTTHEDQTPVHKDLSQSFQNLAIHLAILTGYVSVKQVKNIETPKEELSEGFHVNGISVKSGDDPGVVISGHRILDNGKAVILNTPFTRFDEGEESAYKFQDDLQDKIERAEVEINGYLEGEKLGDDPQLALFDADATKLKLNAENIEDAELVTEDGDGEVWKDGKRPKT
jgi:hypothetical protein